MSRGDAHVVEDVTPTSLDGFIEIWAGDLFHIGIDRSFEDFRKNTSTHLWTSSIDVG